MSVWIIRKFCLCSFQDWDIDFDRDYEFHSKVIPNCYFSTKAEAQKAIREYIEYQVKKLKSVYVPIIKEEKSLSSLFEARKLYEKEYPHTSNSYVFPAGASGDDKYVFVPVKLRSYSNPSDLMTPDELEYDEHLRNEGYEF